MKKFSKILKGDNTIWAIFFFFAIISIITVYSSVGSLAYREHQGNTEFYLIKQVIIFLIGFLFIWIISSFININTIKRISKYGIYFIIPLLLYTSYKGIRINNANRWISVFGQSFQPSDLAKPLLIMYVAFMISYKRKKIHDFKTVLIYIFLPVFVISGIIFYSNLSTAGILLVTCFLLMFIGRIKFFHLSAFAGIILISGLLFFLIQKASNSNKGRLDTGKNRIEQFFDSEPSEHVNQSKIAISTAGIFGKFAGHNIHRNLLPLSYSDFIFAMIVEQFGMVGGIFTVLLYFILFFRCIIAARKKENLFQILLIFGLGFIITFQAMIHILVNVGLFPVTGQTLPLISMGGTSIIFTCISLGIILNITREVENE
ncbi:MAG: FtsW/RodA/SpoVE family cell cycle protein [Bacteroidales bacterium]|nr:FtsW/RodA/SpoVE family cell cycle protein [Bacteroidales bacterium]